MKLISYAKLETEFVPIEVEVSLVPGLPIIQFIGQANASIKESASRIKSALHHQGFRMPKAKQVLVNLRPQELKKNCPGLDLAVAAAIIWKTSQGQSPKILPTVYGELTLTGEVLAPIDLPDIDADILDQQVLTGSFSQPLNFPTLQINKLRELDQPRPSPARTQGEDFKRPEFSLYTFAREKARVLSLIAAGEHATLFAGPAGSGKSTLARHVRPLLSPPNRIEWDAIRKIWKKQSPAWRPEVSPHHTMTAKSFIGGSSQLRRGEISQAHGGVLILDELLEFPGESIEALREPCDTGTISLSVTGRRITYPAKFLLLATSNLCSCGAWLPQENYLCRCSNFKRKLYLQRLSGPFLDRFQILYFTGNKRETDFKTQVEILNAVEKARNFALTHRDQTRPNGELSLEELTLSTSNFLMQHLVPQGISSHRRKLSVLRVARTIADLEKSKEIRPAHLEEAISYALRPFTQLAQG